MLFNTLTALSLLLAIGVAMLWAHSYWQTDYLWFQSFKPQRDGVLNYLLRDGGVRVQASSLRLSYNVYDKGAMEQTKWRAGRFHAQSNARPLQQLTKFEFIWQGRVSNFAYACQRALIVPLWMPFGILIAPTAVW